MTPPEELDPLTDAGRAGLLRKRAESRVARVLDDSTPLDPAEARALVHELSVHQIELDMQNEQLRHTHAALETSRARYLQLYEEAPIAFVSVTAVGRILSVNQSAAIQFRAAAESMLRRSIQDFVPPEFYPAYITQRDAILASGTADAFDLQMRRADGSMFWATLQMSLAREEEAGSAVFRIAISDISERKLLEETSARLAAIVTSADLAIISLTLSGEIVSWNAGAQRLFGYEAAAALHLSSELILPSSRNREDLAASARIVRGETVACETMRLRNDGSPIAVFLTSSPIYSEAGKVVGVSQIMRDIGEQVASRENLSLLLEELRRRELQLQTADRRKDEFIATLAHELRNPLAPIRNATEILRQLPGLGERALWCGQVIDRQVTQMSTLLEDLLDVSRITRNSIPIQHDRITLQMAITQAIEMTQPLLTSRLHELKLEMPSEPIEVEGDLSRLTQVFANLITNAAKYTDVGGTVTVQMEVTGNDVKVHLTDTGIGIGRDQLIRIFELFSQVGTTTDRTQGGLGIGLFLVKGLVELHRGTIDVRSEGLGLGTTFTICLPLYASNPSDSPIHRRIGRRGPGQVPGRRRVLIAEDNADEANTLAALLSLNDFEVTVALDGAQALEIAGSLQPEIIVIDIGMPKLTGYEVTQQIRLQPWGRDIFIVAYTGWSRPEDRRRSREAGIDVHLSKPVAPSRLLEMLASTATSWRG